jgi:hypothetical protein
MTNSSARGYDDTRELMEMAVGLFDGRFKSVDHAARSVLSDPKQSNVDRLRRKFRQQGWIDRGREEFLRQSVEGDIGPDAPPETLANYMRVIRGRLRHPVATVQAIFTKDIFWNAPWIQMTFHVWWLTLLPVVVSLARIALGFGPGEGFNYWIMAFFVFMSLMPMSFCLLTLEDHEGFPTLLGEDSRGDTMDQAACPT